ncbi:MAG: hypothetical protein R3D55_17760 [Chloroflexota bacterium]
MNASGDLHLLSTASSAMTDQGMALALYTDDVDGQSRPFGPHADLGADELNAPPFTPTNWVNHCPW